MNLKTSIKYYSAVTGLSVLLVCGYFALCSMLTGCASMQGQSTGTIVGDIVTDVTTGAVAVSDGFTALNAAQQAMGGHGISLANIGAYATAEASAANTSGLGTAVSNLVSDITSQLKAGATPAQITTQLTQAQIALSASVTPAPTVPATNAPTSTTYPVRIRAPFGEKNAFAVLKAGQKRSVVYPELVNE